MPVVGAATAEFADACARALARLGHVISVVDCTDGSNRILVCVYKKAEAPREEINESWE